ncbi:MAG: helix-turn-helix domain-containing protein, partial [Trebonia sp.]
PPQQDAGMDSSELPEAGAPLTVIRASTLTSLLTDRDVAAVLAVRPDTVRRWAARGELPSVRLGRLLRFRSEDVDRWIAGHLTMAPASRPLRRRPGSIRTTGQRTRIGR